MRRSLAVVLILLAVPAGVVRAQEAARSILVTGSAQVETAPDRATVTAGVESQADTAGAALAATATAMEAVFAALERLGIAPADIQTSQLGLDPIWQNQGATDAGTPPTVVGYQASNLVAIRVREIPRLGAVIDALGEAGINRMHGIAFEVSDPRPQLDAARAQAVADARAQAELYARAAGVTLGPVLTIRDGGTPGLPQPMFARSEMSMDMPVAEGSVAVEAQVEMVFAIE